MIGIGLLGCGTVGSGVVKLIRENRNLIASRLGEEVVLVKVLEKDPDKLDKLGISGGEVAGSFAEIVNHPDIDIVIEVMGGLEPARSYILEAFKKGKSVVTANKDLIAVSGGELLDAAAAAGVDFMFEASVGGGIPVILPLKQSLAANRFIQVIGIVNGTTNYILTKMSEERKAFNDVLREAQALGYAESDPTSDIEGYDAARKLAILASIAFNSRVTFSDVFVEGISGISPIDIQYGQELGYTVKLLAIAKEMEERLQVRVHPAFIPADHPLASVSGVFNAVFITGDKVGDVMMYGRGAGQDPTASAVLGDVMEIVRNMVHGNTGRIGCTCFAAKEIMPISELVSKYYIRLTVKDRPGVLAAIASVFGNNEVSLASVLQKTEGEEAQLVLITHRVREANLRDSLAVLEGMSIVREINSVIRVEGEVR